MIKRVFSFAAMILFCANCVAAPISLETAKRISTELLSKISKSGFRNNQEPLSLEKQSSSEYVGYPLYYIFNRPSGGFAIVAGDDCMDGVLAYSECGRIDSDNMPDNMAWWLREYEKKAKYAIDNGIKMKRAEGRRKEKINPLLSCTWDQGYPYNILCPTDAEGKYCYTGCVATAMAQIMYYHRWPETGFGSNEYTFNINNEPSCPLTLSADFGSTTYQWDEMLDDYWDDTSDVANAAVATLMLHCGIGLEMVYGTSGSSPTRMNEVRALRRYFRYYYDAVNLQHVSDEDFSEIVYNELTEKRPVLVGGKNRYGGDGHLFVCDGYMNGYFHVNWGWSGAGDTYCHPDALIPSVGVYDYSDDHRLIYNIRPYKGEMPDGQVDVTVELPGTLEEQMPEKAHYASSLKVSGPLNGTDMLTLRKMCGRDEYEIETEELITELDMEDASFVPGGEVYCENYTVTSETAFPNHGLYYTNLKRVVLPKGISTIDKCAFEMCQQLEEVMINEDVERIEQEAFYYCTSLKSITLPEKLSFVGPWAFDKNDQLANILVLATKPPVAYGTSFPSVCYNNATLYVPLGAKTIYQETAPWNNFENIIEVDFTTSIENTDTRSSIRDDVYSLSGMRVDDAKSAEKLPKGIYIVNGKKVLR